MIVKYKALFGKIKEIEVEAETKKFVKLPGGRREAKSTVWYSYHETWEEARDKLVKDAERNAARHLERHKSALAKIDALRAMTEEKQ